MDKAAAVSEAGDKQSGGSLDPSVSWFFLHSIFFYSVSSSSFI